MGLYMNQMPPMNNQPQGYLDGYQNIYYYNNINSSYQFPTQMIGYNPYFHQYTFMEQPKTLEEHIEIIATIAYNTLRKSAAGKHEGLLTSMLVMWKSCRGFFLFFIII